MLFCPFSEATPDDELAFYARYDVAGSSYKVADFVATAPGDVPHGLGLLGMGDSYISGQGTYSYRDGTDTAVNQCHQSELAYPFILGVLSFNSYNSVACSGARTFDVIGTDPNFTGQVTDNIKAKDRDRASVLADFLPGYLYQQEFAAAYKPEAILVSVGGDDIGFADIVKECVLPGGGGTCYSTYEDRVELVDQINGIYNELVNTYTTLQRQSGGSRMYVVGYPQVAAPGGDCGVNVRLNSSELTFASELIAYLDSVIRQAAQASGVLYVDTQDAFDGHRLCEPGAKAMNGLTLNRKLGGPPVAPESYHPTRLGYELLAQSIAAQTSNLTTPMPAQVSASPPSFDPNLSLLQTVPPTGRPINWVVRGDTTMPDLVVRGELEQLATEGNLAQLRPGSSYQVVLHSDPVVLATGSVSADGSVAAVVRIPPESVPSGYHVLHVYSTNLAGEPVDIQKVIYVAASADDYDGDGVLNADSPCLVLPPSGQDADGDGTDDACDPEIADIIPADIPPPPGPTVDIPVGPLVSEQTAGLAITDQAMSTAANFAVVSPEQAVNVPATTPADTVSVNAASAPDQASPPQAPSSGLVLGDRTPSVSAKRQQAVTQLAQSHPSLIELRAVLLAVGLTGVTVVMFVRRRSSS